MQAGVVQIRSAQAIPAADLKKKYLELLNTQSKPFGYIVRAIANPSVQQGSPGDTNDILVMMAMLQGAGGPAPGGPVILQLSRVMPDGKEELVRGLRFGAIAPATFRDIHAASEERLLYSYRATPASALLPGAGGGGSAIVSVIVPNFIFDELEIQRIKDVAQKPPPVPSPLRH